MNCVTVIDDDPSDLRSTTGLLKASGFRVAACASVEQLIRETDPAAPGCLLIDLALRGLDGLALQRALSEAGDARPVIFMSSRADIGSAVSALKAGAIDFLTKPLDEAKLVAAVRAAPAAEREGRDRRAARVAWELKLDSLTAREKEVLHGVVEGKLNKQIAWNIGIAEKTVKVYRGRVMEKMAVDSLAELVRAWLGGGVIAQP